MATNVLTTSTLSTQGGPTTPSTSKEFEEERFMKDLLHLRDSQDAIQGLSGWCIRNRKNNAYKIARCWLKCLKKVKVDQKLTLFHLLNDVVQHSKKRNYDDLLDKFQVQIREAMPHLKNTKITEKIIRCLNIWSERQVFEDKFVQELIASIDPSQNRAEQDILDNFQPQQLCTQIKIMKALEDDTDYKLRTVKESELNLMEMDESSLRQNLKDRQHGNDYINDVEDGRKRLEQYIKAIDRELTKRRQVIEMLTHAGKYYDSLLGEANIVATAYTNFGKRVKNLNRKLEERMEENKDTHATKSKRHFSGTSSLDGQASEFLEDISPVPTPDYDAPSPLADELELQLPDDTHTFNSNAVGSHNSSGNPTPLTQSPQPARVHEPKGSAVGGNGTLIPSSGDLSSRLDSMTSSRLKDVTSYPSVSIPQNFGEFSASKEQSMSKTNISNSSGNGSKLETSQNSSGFSISEYLTKLAKGNDSLAHPNYQHGATSHYHNESIEPANSSYSHPPPLPQSARLQDSSQHSLVPQDRVLNEANWWPQQPPPLPPHATNPPPITSWSRDGDPPPVTAWPAPRPDVWSSANQDQSSNWQQTGALDPVPEWQLPIQEEDPPDTDSIPYRKHSNELYNENRSLLTPQKPPTSRDTAAYGGVPQQRERTNSSTSIGNNLIPLTRGAASVENQNNSNPFSASGSHNPSISKVVKPSPHSHPPTHLIHDDMEMCSDEDDEANKESQFDSFAFNKYEQRSGISTGNMHTQQFQPNIPPLMSEEQFNNLKYNAPNTITIPPPSNTSSTTALPIQNGPATRMGLFSNPPPSFGVDPPSHSQFSPVPSTRSSRVNPYLPAAPKELTKEEQEEEKRTRSLQDRLRNLAGVSLENQSDDRNNSESNALTPSFPSTNGQENGNQGHNFSHGGRGSSNQGSLGSQFNEFRGGQRGSPFSGPRNIRPLMGGNWGGGPMPGPNMRGMRGVGRSRPAPRY